MCYFESFTGFSVEKNSPANAGDTGDSRLILGSGRSLWPKEEEKTKEGEMATHSRIPAGIIPWTEEPDGLQSIGSQRVWHDRANTCTCIVFNIPSHFDLSIQLWLSFELCNYKVYWVYRKLWGQSTASTHRVIHTITESLDSWVQFSSVNHVWLFATPWTAAHQASLSMANSRSLLKLMSIELVMPSNHLVFCCPLLLLPSIFPSIRSF